MSYLDVITLKTCSIVLVNYTQHAHVHQLSQMDSIGMNSQTGGGAKHVCAVFTDIMFTNQL